MGFLGSCNCGSAGGTIVAVQFIHECHGYRAFEVGTHGEIRADESVCTYGTPEERYLNCSTRLKRTTDGIVDWDDTFTHDINKWTGYTPDGEYSGGLGLDWGGTVLQDTPTCFEGTATTIDYMGRTVIDYYLIILSGPNYTDFVARCAALYASISMEQMMTDRVALAAGEMRRYRYTLDGTIIYAGGTDGPPEEVKYRQNTSTLDDTNLPGLFYYYPKDPYFSYAFSCNIASQWNQAWFGLQDWHVAWTGLKYLTNFESQFLASNHTLCTKSDNACDGSYVWLTSIGKEAFNLLSASCVPATFPGPWVGLESGWGTGQFLKEI